MQALTGLFARQFGTPNYAAHGGFCSVNMAAGMIYTVGGSFWEFGGPDLDRAKLFVMIGTAEDHHSNPMKIAWEVQARGRPLHLDQPGAHRLFGDRRRVDPDPPGTDGALFMALLHELIRTDLVDRPFLQRFTNAPQLVVLDEGEREGLFAFDPAAGPPGDGRHPHNKLVWDLASGRVVQAYPEGIADGCDPALEGHYTLADGTRVAPAFQLLRDRVEPTARPSGQRHHRHPGRAHPPAGARVGGDRAAPGLRTAHPLDRRLGEAAPHHPGRPVAFHAMRGLAAHSNGFQTVRALAVLMSVLGTIDAPGGFRHKAPYPRHIVPNYRAFNDPSMIQPNTPLNAAPLGFPAAPGRAGGARPTARRSASTTRSRGSTRCRRTG
jgi:anaerobic selenocysteine-containing dehydrogenase